MPMVVEEALKDALGVDWKVRCEAGSPADCRGVRVRRDGGRDPAQREDEESMLAEAGSDSSETPRRDPEEAALELLQNELGARRIDGPEASAHVATSLIRGRAFLEGPRWHDGLLYVSDIHGDAVLSVTEDGEVSHRRRSGAPIGARLAARWLATGCIDGAASRNAL